MLRSIQFIFDATFFERLDNYTFGNLSQDSFTHLGITMMSTLFKLPHFTTAVYIDDIHSVSFDGACF